MVGKVVFDSPRYQSFSYILFHSFSLAAVVILFLLRCVSFLLRTRELNALLASLGVLSGASSWLLWLIDAGTVVVKRLTHHSIFLGPRLSKVKLVNLCTGKDRRLIITTRSRYLPLIIHSKAVLTFEESSALVSISAICSRSA